MEMENDDGKPLMFHFKFRKVCDECKKLEPVLMRECTHCGYEPLEVDHKDSIKRDRYALIYSLANMEEVNINENLGDPTRSGSACFSLEDINRAFTMPRVSSVPEDVSSHIRQITVTIDPNGGGNNQTAYTIGYFNHRTKNLVVSTFILFSEIRDSHRRGGCGVSQIDPRLGT